MEKVNKKTEIKKMLTEGKSIKEISEIIKTNVAYIYKLKKENDQKDGCQSQATNG